MATITANVGAAGNWTVGGTWIGGVAPTAADDAVIPLATTSITIDAGALCRSADFNTFTGTLTMGATGTLTIGDGTAGASNIALRIPSGATFAPNATAVFTFVSTSATLQTIAISNTYSMCAMTFNSTSNGNYALTVGINNVNGLLTLTKGTLHMDGTTDNSGLIHSLNALSSTNSNVRALLLGNSTMNITGGQSWDITISTNMTLTKGGSTIQSSSSTVTVQTGGLAYNNIVFTGSGTITVAGAGCSFNNLTRTGTASLTGVLNLPSSITITGNFTITGDSSINRVLVQTSSIGVTTTVTNTGATQIWSNADFRDVSLTTIYDASAISGGSGDCGGNSNITFTTATPKFAVAAGNWSSTSTWSLSNGGSSGAAIPLPQDSVTINGNSGVGTITQDMLRTGKNVDLTGYTGTIAISVVMSTYGSWTQSSSLTSSGAGTINFEGRGSHTVTSNGKTFGQRLIFSSFGGTYTLNDAINSINSAFTITNGTFISNGFSITCLIFTASGGSLRTVNITNSLLTCSSNGSNPFDNTTVTNLTWIATGSTILMSDNVSSKNFIGGGITYGNLVITGGGAGTQTILGANTFKSLRVVGGVKSIILPGSTTTTFTGESGLGNGTNLITFTASAGSATVAQNGGIVNWDYVNLTNIPASGTAAFYAGPLTHSTDGGGNTNWIFTNAPGGGGGASNAGALSTLPIAYAFI